jgi:hypothetical protein
MQRARPATYTLPIVFLLLVSVLSEDVEPSTGVSQLASKTDKARIAIIGSGIGGTTCAYFVKQLLGDRAQVHV